jgi:haloalkane dehalogenase
MNRREIVTGMGAAAALLVLPPSTRAKVDKHQPENLLSGGGASQPKGTDSIPPFLEHRVPREGHFLYAREYKGEGPTFVLLHGYPDNLHIYDLLIPVLVAAGRHVVAFDFLGFGASDKPAGGDYGFRQQLGDLHAVVDFLKLNSIVPVAHDAGGVAAINFTMAKPKSIAGLVLLNTFYADAPTLRIPELIELFSLPQTRAFGLAMASDPKELAFLLRFQQLQFEVGVSQAQIDVIDKLVQPLIFNNFAQQPSAGPAFAALAADLRPQIAVNNLQVGKLAELGIPTTIVWGRSDAYLNVGVAQDLAGHFKGASVHLLDAGHWPQLDLPEDVGRYLLAER